MRFVSKKLLTTAIFALMGIGLTGLGAAYLIRGRTRPDTGRPPPAAERQQPAELIPGVEHTIRLSPDAVGQFGLKTAEVQKARPPKPLQLPGTLLLDTNHFARVRTRFAGEVVEISTLERATADPSGPSPGGGPVRLGDQVRKGQLLAVVWSKDLGEKKSELVDAVSRLRLDQETLRRLEEAYVNKAAPERSLREAERSVEADRIAVERARRTLRSWRLGEDEIQAVESEAQPTPPGKLPGDKDADEAKKKWARVEVRAPIRGVLLEVNATLGDVVDTALDLFKIADLSRLRVAAHAPEEDVAALQQLAPEQCQWTLRLQSEPDAPPLRGTFDQIGLVIDPNQRTAAVTGSVENLENERGERRLRVGQLLLAEIPLPAPDNQVVVPRSALIEQGYDCSVFVQPDPTVPQFTCRKVALVRRSHTVAYVRAEPTPEEERRGCRPLKPGERVVSAGAVELAAAWKDLSVSGTSQKRPDASAKRR